MPRRAVPARRVRASSATSTSRSTARRAITASPSSRVCRSSTAIPRGFCDKGDSRHMRVTLGGGADGLEIHNFYVPAGGDEPDPAINDKFAHKLAFVDEMAAWFAAEPDRRRPRDPGRRPQHRAARTRRLEPQGAPQRRQPHADRGRETEPRPGGRPLDRRAAPFVPAEQKLYTWWSYRSPDWAKADKGRRLDHVWVSPALADKVEGDAGAARRARLGAPLRPRAGDRRAGAVNATAARDAAMAWTSARRAA